MSATAFAEEVTTLFAAPVALACRASVVIPARNEEAALEATLDALRRQVDLAGDPLPHDLYEVLLLLNNCTDASARVARQYQQQWPDFRLHVAECHLEPGRAHVGTARRLLLDAACASRHPPLLCCPSVAKRRNPLFKPPPQPKPCSPPTPTP